MTVRLMIFSLVMLLLKELLDFSMLVLFLFEKLQILIEVNHVRIPKFKSLCCLLSISYPLLKVEVVLVIVNWLRKRCFTLTTYIVCMFLVQSCHCFFIS